MAVLPDRETCKSRACVLPTPALSGLPHRASTLNVPTHRLWVDLQHYTTTHHYIIYHHRNSFFLSFPNAERPYQVHRTLRRPLLDSSMYLAQTLDQSASSGLEHASKNTFRGLKK